MLSSLNARIIALTVFAAFLLFLIGFGVTQCQKRQSLGAQNKVTQGQLGAANESGRDAVQTTGNVGASERSSEDLTRSNEKEIRDAEGSMDSVNPAARNAGLRSLCRRAAYRDSERCKLLQPPAQ